MTNLKVRSYEAEIMDDLNLGGQDMDRTLDELEIINRLLGGHNVTTSGIASLLQNATPGQSLKIADLGCGGGDMLRLLDKWLQNKGVQAKLTGIDANPAVTSYAREHSEGYPNINYLTEDIFGGSFAAQEYDIILCSLFCHHFTNEQLERLFARLKRQARLGVVINDLHRHWFAYQSIKYITKFFSRSPLVRHDACLSVARGFLKSDLEEILAKAGIGQYKMKWMWAFRWQLIF